MLVKLYEIIDEEELQQSILNLKEYQENNNLISLKEVEEILDTIRADFVVRYELIDLAYLLYEFNKEVINKLKSEKGEIEDE